MARNVTRVLPDSGRWKVTFNGNRDSEHMFKEWAINRGRELAKMHLPSQLIIHKADGTIESEYTYGQDPFPPRG